MKTIDGKTRKQRGLGIIFICSVCVAIPIGATHLQKGGSTYTLPRFSLDGETPEEKKNPPQQAHNIAYGIIAGNVWHDKDINGLQHPNRTIEKGVAKIRVELLNEEGLTLTNTETDASGFYQFQQLNFGQYFIHFVVPFRCQLSPQNVKDDHRDSMDSDPDVSTGLSEILSLNRQSAAKLNVSAGLRCHKLNDLLNPSY